MTSPLVATRHDIAQWITSSSDSQLSELLHRLGLAARTDITSSAQLAAELTDPTRARILAEDFSAAELALIQLAYQRARAGAELTQMDVAAASLEENHLGNLTAAGWLIPIAPQRWRLNEVLATAVPRNFFIVEPSHLKVLRAAGLLTSERRASWVYYAVVPEALREIAALLDLHTAALTGATA